MHIELMTAADWPAVEAIYREGIITGHATFATEPPPSWEAWSAGKINQCSLVARAGDEIVGWAAIALRANATHEQPDLGARLLRGRG